MITEKMTGLEVLEAALDSLEKRRCGDEAIKTVKEALEKLIERIEQERTEGIKVPHSIAVIAAIKMAKEAIATLDSLAISSTRDALKDAYTAGFIKGFNAPCFEMSDIDEDFVGYIDNAMGDNEAALDSLAVESSEDAREFYFRLLSIAPDGDKSVAFITARDERIRRECADKAECYADGMYYLDRDCYDVDIDSLRAAIMGRKE
jgi:uncharacterized protein (UPF0210 family)